MVRGGTQLKQVNVCSAPVNLPTGNSGIAVGGPDLYLANNGGQQIFKTDKGLTSGSTLFHQGDRRIEDVECDNATFSAQGKGATWFVDAYDREIKALEIPANLCGSGGLPPVEGGPGSASCSDNIDNDGDGAIDAADSGCGAVAPAGSAGGPGVSGASLPRSCDRRVISLIRADRKGDKVELQGLVGRAFYGKSVKILVDGAGAGSSAFKTVSTVKASASGTFKATLAKPGRRHAFTTRYRAAIGRAVSPTLKLPQSLRSKSVKASGNKVTVTGVVNPKVLGSRKPVSIQALACGRYRTVGSARPDSTGAYKVTFNTPRRGGVAFYRARGSVLRKPGSKVYVTQYARAIAIRLTAESG